MDYVYIHQMGYSGPNFFHTKGYDTDTIIEIGFSVMSTFNDISKFNHGENFSSIEGTKNTDLTARQKELYKPSLDEVLAIVIGKTQQEFLATSDERLLDNMMKSISMKRLYPSR